METIMDDADGSPMVAGGSRNMKRKQVAIACFACQKRKSKCDGNRPVCQPCIRKGTDCTFDADGDSRRTENLKRKVMALSMQNDADAATMKGFEATIEGYDTILRSLKSSSPEAALDLIRYLQTAPSMDEAVRHCEANASHSPRHIIQEKATSASQHNPRTSALEARISELENYLQNLQTSAPERIIEQVQQLQRQPYAGSASDFSSESNLNQSKDNKSYRGNERHSDPDREARYESGLPYSAKSLRWERKNDMSFLLNPVVEVPKGSEYELWTNVVDDGMVIEQLIDIYFTWYHSSAPAFSEELFRQDMINGKNRYCSRILVNAILSLACYLPGQRGAGRTAKIKTETAVEFLKEAERLLLEAPEPSLMNIAALTIMATVEVQRCRFGQAWMHSRQASTMAIYLNLNQRVHNVDSTDQTDRRLTFWTVFQLDQFTSAIFKRSPAIILHNVGVDVPPDKTEFETKAWPSKAFEKDFCIRPYMESRYMNFASRLAKIVNVALDADHAANYVYTPVTILKVYREYRSWFEELQVDLPLETGSPPHVLNLHMWYHSRVISLLKPILGTQLSNTNINPLDICRQSALSISHFYHAYVNMFHLRGLHNQIGLCMLEACTVHAHFLRSDNAEYVERAQHFLQQAVGTYELLQRRLPAAGSIVHEITGMLAANGIDLGPHLEMGQNTSLYLPVDLVNRPPEKIEWKDPLGIKPPVELERKPKFPEYDHFYKPRGT